MHVRGAYLDRVILTRRERVASGVRTRSTALMEVNTRARRGGGLLRATLVLQLVLLIANGLLETLALLIVDLAISVTGHVGAHLLPMTAAMLLRVLGIWVDRIVREGSLSEFAVTLTLTAGARMTVLLQRRTASMARTLLEVMDLLVLRKCRSHCLLSVPQALLEQHVGCRSLACSDV